MTDSERVNTTGNAPPVALRRLIPAHFNDAELQIFAPDVGLDYEELPGQVKSSKVVHLIQTAARHGALLDLITLCQTERPNTDRSAVRSAAVVNPKLDNVQATTLADEVVKGQPDAPLSEPHIRFLADGQISANVRVNPLDNGHVVLAYTARAEGGRIVIAPMSAWVNLVEIPNTLFGWFPLPLPSFGRGNSLGTSRARCSHTRSLVRSHLSGGEQPQAFRQETLMEHQRLAGSYPPLRRWEDRQGNAEKYAKTAN